MTEIGRRVFTAREGLRLNQEDFADRAGLSRAYISRLERGLVPNPTISDLQRVATAAGVPITDLILPDDAGRRYSTDLNEIAAELEGEPPEVAESITRMLRISLEIAKASRLAQQN